ncbi:MAG TPA: hypothetical protein VK338_04285 [Candidatus Nitrosocosmicus sp.]|nr:hypothetical protein [Candidatus Nitrosocosmicus sp.]
MFYGITESESFDNPTILNNFKHHKVIIEKREDGKGYWHIFILHIKNNEIQNTTKEISKSLKADWNAMFFNNEILYTVFKDKIFKLKREYPWRSKKYLEVRQYAKDCGVGDIDFNTAFDHYNRLLNL